MAETKEVSYDGLKDAAYSDSSTNAAQRRVKSALQYSLKNKYGIDDDGVTRNILKVHGLDESSFDVIARAEKCLSEGLSDTSFDQNSNKAGRTVGGLLNETATIPFAKILGYRELYRKMKELYGKNEAKRLSGEMYDFSLGLNDSSNILKPYSYYGNTEIIVRINGTIKITTLKNLFEEFKFSSVKEDDMDAIHTEDIEKKITKNPTFIKEALNNSRSADFYEQAQQITKKYNIEVWDTTNGWVNISRIIKHHSDKDMVLYQTDDGNFAMVTEDHPVIMNDKSEKNASELAIGDKVLVENNLPELPKEVYNVPNDLAYTLGFLLGDGNMVSYEKDSSVDNDEAFIKFVRGGNLISVFQKNIEDSYPYGIIKKVLGESAHWYSSTGAEDRVRYANCPDLAYIASVFCGFGYKENSFTKHLPENFFEWEQHSKEAYLAGFIDADGTVFKNGRISIRVMSYAVINGLYDVLRTMKAIHQNGNVIKGITSENIDDLSYRIDFRCVDENTTLFEYSEKLQKNFSENENFFDFDDKFSQKKEIGKVVKIVIFNRSNITETRFLNGELESVYDITTDTGRFYANGMVQHNCYSYDFSKLVLEGRTWGQLKSLPPKRVSSYIAALSETVHNLASETAGACAISSFFLDVAHIIIFNEKQSLFTVKHSKKYRKYIENSFQSLVHSVNHLSRNSVESPFTNVSIMDTPKIEGLVADDNMGWYFKDSKWSKKNIVSLIKELQDIWMDFFDKGDPSADGRPYRFPVMTLNITKGKDGKVIDKDFVKKMSKREIFRYNIMVSKAGKFANCCFGPNQEFYYFDKEGNKVLTNFKDYVYKNLPKTEAENYCQKVVEKVSGEKIIDPTTGEKAEITAVAKLPNTYKELITFVKEDGTELKLTPDQKIWDNNSKSLVEAKDILKNPDKYDI